MSPTKESIYNKHFKELTSYRKIEEYSDDKIKRCFKRVLQFLPNNGKLYKYRQGHGKAFDLAFDSLKNGYMWFAKPSTLNDEIDVTLSSDPVLNKAEIVEIMQKSHKYKEALFLAICKQEPPFLKCEEDKKVFKKILSFYDLNDRELNESQAIKCLRAFGFDSLEIDEYLSSFNYIVGSLVKDKDKIISGIVSEFNCFNDDRWRDNFLIYSLCSNPLLANMWSDYSGGSGFCIEYDFNKALSTQKNSQRLLLSIYKVTYVDNRKPYSFKDDISLLLSGNGNQMLKRNIIKELTTKLTKWSKEQEWRIFLNNIDNRVFIDIVSSIILDESFIDTDNGKRLIKLATERKWKLYKRTNDRMDELP